MTDSGLTSGRIPYASTGGLLIDNSDFLFNGQDLTFGTGRGFILYDTSDTRSIQINYNYNSAGSSSNYIDFRAGETTQGCGFEMIPGTSSSGRGSTMFLYNLGRPIVDANWERAQIHSKSSTNPTGLVFSWGKGGTGVMRDISVLLGVTNTFNVIAGVAQSANLQEWQDSSYNILSSVSSGGNFGIRMTGAPTAYLHLGAGTATAGTAPLKFTSGTLTTAAVAGQIEYLSGKFYVRGTEGWAFGAAGEYINSANANYLDLGATTAIRLNQVIYIPTIKSGATQAAAGAAANEVWKTSGHATLPDNVLMHGI